MDITWVGGGCFRFRGRGGAVVTDPQTLGPARKSAQPRADLVAVSEPGASADAAALVRPNRPDRTPFAARGPGEYDVSGIYLQGMAGPRTDDGRRGPTVYAMDVDGVSVAFVPSLAVDLSRELLDELGTNHVLVLNADHGGERVADLVSRVEPHLVVPFGRAADGRTPWLDTAKALGETEPTPETTVSVSASSLPESLAVRLLTPRLV